MRKYQSVVEDVLHHHKLHNRYIALLTALSMLMAFTVSMILIEPAESQTGELICGQEAHVHSIEDCYTLACDLEESEEHQHSYDCLALTCEIPEHEHSQDCYETVDEEALLMDELVEKVNDPQDGLTIQPLANQDVMTYAATGGVGFGPDDGSTFGIDEVIEDINGIPGKDFPTITKITINNENEYIQGGNYQWTVPEDADEWELSFKLEYDMPQAYVTLEQPYIYYQLPEGITLPEGAIFGVTATVIGEKNSVVGYYSISETGLIVIRFNDKYIKENIATSTTAITGYIEFNAMVARKETAKGDRDLNFQGETTITVAFPDRDSYDVLKSGKANIPKDTSQQLAITWTVTAVSYGESESLNGFEVHDDKFPANGADVTFKIIPDDGNGSPYTANAAEFGEFRKTTNAENKDVWYYVFTKDLPEGANRASFSFKETIDTGHFRSEYGNDYQWTAENTATLDHNGKGIHKSKKGKVDFEGKPSLAKHGDPVYTNDDDKKYIDWTVTVAHPYNLSLQGYSLVDEAFVGAEILSIKDRNNYELVSETSAYSRDGDKITINADISKVVIKYRKEFTGEFTEQNPDKISVPNTVALYPPEGIYDNQKVKEFSTSADYENQYQLKNKYGEYDRVERKITWTVGAYIKDTESGATLNGYQLADPALKNIDLSSASVNVSTNDSSITVASRTADQITFSNNAVIKKTGSTLTVSGSLLDFTITYQTDPKQSPDDGTTTSEINGRTYISNSVSDNHHHHKDSSPGPGVDVTPNDTISKSYTGSSLDDVLYADTDDAAIQGTLSWEILMNKDAGFTAQNLIDTVSASVEGSNHWIDLSSIVVEGSPDGEGYTNLTENNTGNQYYKISSDGGNVQTFTLTFQSEIDSANYHYIRITYRSKITIDPSTLTGNDDGEMDFKFSNTADNGKSSSADHTIKVKDKSIVEKKPINITKTWVDNDKTQRPDSIKFYMQRKLGNGAWETIYWNYRTNSWEPIDGSVQEYQYVYEILLTDDWEFSLERHPEFNQFPMDTTDHNGNYSYQAVELEVSGYGASYGGPVNAGGTFGITNTKGADYKKHALDPNSIPLDSGSSMALGDLIGPIELTEYHYPSVGYGDLEPATGTYYLIKYEITYLGSERHKIIDTLPDGFSLVCTETQNTDDDVYQNYHPKILYAYGGEYQAGKATDNVGDARPGYNYNSEGEAEFYLTSSAKSVTYYIKIDAETLEGLVGKNPKGYKVKNSIHIEGDQIVENELFITGGVSGGPSEPQDGSLLTKKLGDEQTDIAQQSKIEYSLYVNADGKDLANGDMYDVVDLLKLYSKDDPTKAFVPGQLEVKVEEITNVVKDEETGKVISAAPVRRLRSDEYQYHPDYTDPQDVVYESAVRLLVGSGATNERIWYNSPEKFHGDVTLTLRFEGKSGASGTPLKFAVRNAETNNLIDTIDTIFGEDNSAECTFTASMSGESLPLYFEYSEGLGSLERVVHVKSVSQRKVMESEAKLTVTVPDGRALKITYSYIITDENGEYLENGTVITAKNTASLDTGNYSSWDNRSEEFIINQNSSAGIVTGKSPKIVKYNVGSSGQTLTANFYVAKFVGGKWMFAVSDTPELDGTNDIRHNLDFTLDAQGNEIPKPGENQSPALEVEIKSDEQYKLYMDEKILYKIIEITAPDGYEAADSKIAEIGGYGTLKELLEAELGTYLDSPNDSTKLSRPEYYNLLNKFVAVHYFKYGSANPDEADQPGNYSDLSVITVNDNGTIGIPNNELIDIKVTKTWDAGITEKVKVRLYWSYTRPNSSRTYPSDLEPARAEDLGLTSLNNEAEIDPTVTNPEAIWTNLPNGKNDKPIYYYIKEIEYTVNGKTYQLNEAEGKFYEQGTTNEGEYERIYANNGLNKDGTIKVKNTKGLSVTKVWKNSADDVLEWNDADIPVESIPFELYGVKADGSEELIYSGDLTRNDHWTMTMSDHKLIDGKRLSDYTKFRIEEIVTVENGLKEKLYTYAISYGYNLTGITGEITITNKNPTPVSTKVSVNKIWSDEDNPHKAVHVNLYQSKTELADDVAEKLASMSSLPDGVQLMTITTKNADGTEQSVPQKDIELNSENDWKKEWPGLEYKYKDESGQDHIYYYYVVETDCPENYTAFYSRVDHTGDQSITIKNAIPGSLTINKEWYAGNQKVDSSEEVSFQLYRRKKTSSDDSATTTPENPEKKKISIRGYSFGDSITNGFNSGGDPYTIILTQKLKEFKYADYTVEKDYEWRETGEIYNKSIVSQTIEDIEKYCVNAQDATFNSTFNLAMLIAGTNNILNKDDTIEVMRTKMISLIEAVYTRAENNPDLVVLVGSIPEITNGNSRAGMVTSFNEMLKNLIEGENEYYKTTYPNRKIYYVETGKAVGTQLNSDGIHPDKDGQEAIADAFLAKINEINGVTVPGSNSGSGIPQSGADGFPSDFWKDKANGIVNTDYEPVSDGRFTLPEKGSYSKTFQNLDDDYYYYVVETSKGSWTTSYTDNGQTIGQDSSSITVKNTMKGSLDVEKEWKNYKPSTGSYVKVQLYRSKTPPAQTRKAKIGSVAMPKNAGIMARDADDSLYENYEGHYTLTINSSNTVYFGNTIQVTIPEGNYSGWLSFKIADDFALSDFDKLTVTGVSFSPYFSPLWENISSSNMKTWEGGGGGNGFNGSVPKNCIMTITVAEDLGEGTGSGGSSGGNTNPSETTTPESGNSGNIPAGAHKLDISAGEYYGYVVKPIEGVENEQTVKVTLWGVRNANGTINGTAWNSYNTPPEGIKIDNVGDNLVITYTVSNLTGNTMSFELQWASEDSNIDFSKCYYIIEGEELEKPTDPEETTETEEPTLPTEPNPENPSSFLPEDAVKVGGPETLNEVNGWSHTFGGLEFGYYYYVEEVEGGDGFEIDYDTNGVYLTASNSNDMIMITNTNPEDSGVQMPATGGTGTRPYTAVGITLMGITIPALMISTRRRKNDK